MSDKDRDGPTNAEVGPGLQALAAPAHMVDLVVGSSPSYAIGSMMIAASQSHARAMEASVAALTNSYTVSLATTTQCVSRVLGAPSASEREFFAALQSKMFT